MAAADPTEIDSWSDISGRFACGGVGCQVAYSSGERSVLLFVGNLYNKPEILQELGNEAGTQPWQEDCHVLIHALDCWGLERTLAKLNGMFAFTWYNQNERTLSLVRDHAGFKALYYALDPSGQGLSFSTRFDGVLRGPWKLPMEIDQQALVHYLQLSHFPAPQTLIENVFELEAGSYLQVTEKNEIIKRRWFEIPRQIKDGFLPVDEALVELHAVLETSVKRQSQTSQSLGSFLSGGVDSPLISAIMAHQMSGNLKAFSITIPRWQQDEGEDARRYAQQLGLDHHVIGISGEDAVNVIDEVICAQHEPFGDFSIIPSMILFRHSRAKVGVALSGDGGDELFFGYERPFSLLRNGADFRFPRFVRVGMYGLGKFGIIHQKSEVILSRTPGDYYYGVNSRMDRQWLKRFTPDLSRREGIPSLYEFGDFTTELDLANYSRYVEYYGQLQRGLKKVAMASDFQSLDVRSPMLDRQVVELSLRMDPMETMRSGQKKRMLRLLLERFVPSNMIPVVKRGFGIPLGKWMRGPLKQRVEETLFDGELFPVGAFDKVEVNNYWYEHLSGKADHKWGLWNLLALQWWAWEYMEHNR